MLTHPESMELLAAYALDALDPQEQRAVHHHLEGCPACRSEAAEHLRVVALLTPGWGDPPVGSWERIAARLAEPPLPVNREPVMVMERRAGARRPMVAIAALVAVAAVAMIGFLGARVSQDRRQMERVASGAYAEELRQAVNAALADPTAQRVDLTSTDGSRRLETVVLPDGTGYVVRSNLPRLPGDRTYQLWALVGTSRISIGVLGPNVHVGPFKMGDKVLALAVTEEVAGGVETPGGDALAVGRV